MLLLGNMFYGIVFIICHIVFILGYWIFSESLTEIPFFQMGNGLLIFGTSILQVQFTCILSFHNIFVSVRNQYFIFSIYITLLLYYYIWCNLTILLQHYKCFIQALSLCFPAFLLPVTILNVIAGSIAFFMVSYAISNTYFLVSNFISSILIIYRKTSTCFV